MIFAIPAILIGFINGFFLELASKRERIVEKRIWSFVPLLLLVLLAISDFRLLDADISVLGVLGLIAFGKTNIVWNIKMDKNTDKNTLHNNI